MIIGYEFELFLNMQPQIESGNEFYIITRRKDRKRMIKQLQKKKLFYHKLLHFNEEEFSITSVIYHKKRAIRYYQLHTYYEDNPRVAKDLRILCPTTEIILKEFNKLEKDN